MNVNKSLSIRPEFLPLSLLRAVWKHKFLACSISLTVAAVGISVVYRLPAVYKAEALILVDPQKIPERFVTTTVNTDVQDRLATISQEILSSTRLKKIIDDFNLYPKERRTQAPEEVIELMRKDIDIKLEKGMGGNRPGAFRITYEGSNPTLLAQVVDRITNLYIEENLRSREVQAEGTSEFIETQLQEAKKQLDAQELALTHYKLQHNGELPQQENSLISILTRLQVELQGNQDAVNRAQQEKVTLESALNIAESAEASLNSRRLPTRNPARPAVEQTTEESNKQLNSPKQSEVLRAQLAEMRMRYSAEHPDVRRLQARLNAAERLEQQQEESARTAAPAKIEKRAPKQAIAESPKDPAPDSVSAERVQQAHERVANLKAQLLLTKRELERRAGERERIVRDLDSYKRRLEQLPVRELEMLGLMRDYETSKANYHSLLDKKLSAEMSTDLEKRQKAETFRILDPARPPHKPYKPKREMLSGMSIALGLALGVLTAILIELKAGVLLGEWELPAGVVVLSRIPYIEPALAAVSNPSEPLSGKTQRVGLMRRFVIVSSAALSLLGTGYILLTRL